MTDGEKFAELVEKMSPEQIDALIEEAQKLLEEQNG